MIIESKRSGLRVKLPDDDYGKILAEHGEHGAYEHILNQAGRVLKHRNTLNDIRNQKLTAEQQQNVESAARAVAVQSIIDNEIINRGYGNYLRRRDRGGLMPESWGRIVSRAKEQCEAEIERVVVSDDDRNHAMTLLGLYTEEDERWSHRVSDWCRWNITSPNGWGVPKSNEEY